MLLQLEHFLESRGEPCFHDFARKHVIQILNEKGVKCLGTSWPLVVPSSEPGGTDSPILSSSVSLPSEMSAISEVDETADFGYPLAEDQGSDVCASETHVAWRRGSATAQRMCGR